MREKDDSTPSKIGDFLWAVFYWALIAMSYAGSGWAIYLGIHALVSK